MSVPSIPEDELNELVDQIIDDVEHNGTGADTINYLRQLIRQYAAKARLDERKRVALDNYHGHTFSDATNYKYKFDKFVEGNERRIKQLKEGSR